MKFLPLSQGKSAIIDDTDFEKMGQFKWYAHRQPSGNFYAIRNVPGKKGMFLRLHCEILGVKGVDHKSGDGLDCRRENLRPATDQQNKQAHRRKSPGTSSRFRGVCWDKERLKWLSKVKMAGVYYNLGRFEIEEDAARAYDKKAIELGFFPEALNFKPPS